MARVGACTDNDAMEPFFAFAAEERPQSQATDDTQELRLAIITRMEATCHRKRRQGSLGNSAAIEYETIISAQVALVA